ncbi:MAG: RNA methyltransferase [Bacteroidia bacterium]|nr:RNA methyltransferase [Bacteroidia bacterium]
MDERKAYALYLSQFISEKRFALMNKVLNDRTNHITVVLEDIYQTQNTSAVLRTCDCMGIQTVHIVENKNKFDLNPDVELGSAQWLQLHRYRGKDNNTADCLNQLKQQGYRIVATTPHTRSCRIDQLPLNGKLALVFGTEKEGISPIVHEMADEFVVIPMHGFTESYNISVSAALSLYELTKQLRQSDLNWSLPEDEKAELLIHWIKQGLNRPELIEKDYFEKLAQGRI